MTGNFTNCIVHAKQSEITRTEVSKAYPSFLGSYPAVMRV